MKPHVPTGFLNIKVNVTCPHCAEHVNVSEQVLNMGIELNSLINKTIRVICIGCDEEFQFKLEY